MSLDQPVRASGSQAVSLPLVQSDGSSSQEHSFTGKLAQAPRDPDDILPTSSNDRVEVIKRNISARLPGMSSQSRNRTVEYVSQVKMTLSVCDREQFPVPRTESVRVLRSRAVL
mgnify:CR=1 FL=1